MKKQTLLSAFLSHRRHVKSSSFSTPRFPHPCHGNRLVSSRFLVFRQFYGALGHQFYENRRTPKFLQFCTSAEPSSERIYQNQGGSTKSLGFERIVDDVGVLDEKLEDLEPLKHELGEIYANHGGYTKSLTFERIADDFGVLEENLEDLEPFKDGAEGELGEITVRGEEKEVSEVEKEAWRLLERAVVNYCGSPVGTVAADDPASATNKLNYDQVFIRDFVPSALAFMMKGECEIVRNFLLHTLQLQVRTKF